MSGDSKATSAALKSWRWFQSAASELVASLEPLEGSDGGLCVEWGRLGRDHTALFNPDGSLFMHTEDLGLEWDDWSDTIAAPGPGDERRVRDFYKW